MLRTAMTPAEGVTRQRDGLLRNRGCITSKGKRWLFSPNPTPAMGLSREVSSPSRAEVKNLWNATPLYAFVAITETNLTFAVRNRSNNFIARYITRNSSYKACETMYNAEPCLSVRSQVLYVQLRDVLS